MDRNTGMIAGALAGCLAGFALAAAQAPARERWSVALLGAWFGLLVGALLGARRRLRASLVAPQPSGGGMRCEECLAAAVFHLTEARGRLAILEKHLCEPHAHRYLESNPPPEPRPGWALPPREGPAEGIRTAPTVVGVSEAPAARPGLLPTAPGEVLMEVVRIIISAIHEQQVVVLHEVGGPRQLSLACGIFEATSLYRVLKQETCPRPLTHDAWEATVKALGGELQDVIVTKLHEHTYYGEARIRQGGRLIVVDVRPSDALVLALKVGVPILMAERVLREALEPPAAQPS